MHIFLAISIVINKWEEITFFFKSLIAIVSPWFEYMELLVLRILRKNKGITLMNRTVIRRKKMPNRDIKKADRIT